MSISIIENDILTVERGVIIHQVNTLGKMAKGLAGTLRNAYPVVYDSYMRHLNQFNNPLGSVDIVPVSDTLYVAQVFAQATIQSPNRPKTNHTDDNALRNGLMNIRTFAEFDGLPVAIPYGIGAGLAGGDWGKIERIIEQVFDDCLVDVTFYKYGNETEQAVTSEKTAPKRATSFFDV